MNRRIELVTTVLLLSLVVTGCAGDAGTLTVPLSDPKPVTGLSITGQTQTHLWGLFDVYIDIENQTADAITNRSAMFTANVVTFLNSQPAGLTFHINEIINGTDWIDVDINIGIMHPFSSNPEYNGYDVRGVFMGDGSLHLNYNSDLVYPVLGADQFMPADPDDSYGAPDGYTRWFNYTEFSTGGSPLLSYTPGAAASQGFAGTATLNPCRYFADGLGSTENLWNWLNNNASRHGRFKSGATNWRNYYLRFPDSQGVIYGYAIIANWEGVEPQFHPSNAPEAVACNIIDESDLWFVDPAQNGGNLILDISLFGWEYQPTEIFIESTVLSSVYEFTEDDMTPIGGSEHYSTYHVEIPADNVSGTAGNEFWVIAQYDGFDYRNDFGTTNLAGDDPLAALFRYDVSVSNQAPGWIEVLIPNGGEEWEIGSNEEITWDWENVSGTVFIEYSKSNFQLDVYTIAVDEPNDGSFLWENIPDTPSQTARVRISSTDAPGMNDTSDEDFRIYSKDCNDVPFYKLDEGNESCADPGEFGWQYIAPYQDFWNDINCYDPGSGDPPPELPEDPEPIEGGIIHHFAVQLDDRPSTGYFIAFNEVCIDGCDVFIDYTEYVPGPDVEVDPVVTRPWAVAAVELPPVYCWWSWYFDRHEEIYY